MAESVMERGNEKGTVNLQTRYLSPNVTVAAQFW
jgi:hypothetical protein